MIEPAQTDIEAVYAEPKFQQSQDDRYLMAREIVVARDVVRRALDMLTKLAQRGKLQPPAAEAVDALASDAKELLPP